MPKTKAPKKNDTAPNLGFEAKLWQAADGVSISRDKITLAVLNKGE